MHLFLVELEIILFGKEIEYVQAYKKNEAEFIAIHKVMKKFNCPKESVSITSCKKINRN